MVVDGAQGANLALTPVALLRSRENGQPERVTVTAGVLNRTATAATDVPIHLEIDGRVVQDLTISVAPNASASVSFAPLTITHAEHARDRCASAPRAERRSMRWRATTSSTSCSRPRRRCR